MNRSTSICALLLALLWALPGCSGDDPPETEEPLAAHCNPLIRAQCMLPWPSSFYLREDPAAETGYRLAYGDSLLPSNKQGKPIDPTRHNLRDGFSIGVQPVLWLPQGIDPTGLATLDNPAPSITADHPVWLISMPAGERVAFFAEVDANAQGTDQKKAIILRPLEPLKFATRYVVAFKTSARGADGAALRAPEGFARLRDGLSTADPTLEAQRGRISEVLTFLEDQGIARKDLAIAWDFRTQSRASATGPLLSLVDDALQRIPAAGVAFQIKEAKDHADTDEPELWKEIVGTFESPSYLADAGPDAVFSLDTEGKPIYRAPQSFEFRLHVPHCAKTATGPLPVLVFGHGLFRNAHHEPTGEYHKKLIQRLCMVEVSANWIGVSDADLSAIASQVLPDFSGFPRLTDRLEQAHVNMHVLVEMLRGSAIWKDKALVRSDGSAVADGQEMYYYGISNGGIQGFTFAALQKHIERFALNVPGGWWSMMMERSSNFGLLNVLMKSVYPQALDRLLVILSSQAFFDHTDPINYAAVHREGPLAGRKGKRILIQEGLEDDQVPNITTRALVRAAGIPMLSPGETPVLGIDAKTGPLPSAYTQWDISPPSVPSGANVPAPKPPANASPHHVTRRLEDVVEQIQRFWKPQGMVEQTCPKEGCRCKATVDCRLVSNDLDAL